MRVSTILRWAHLFAGENFFVTRDSQFKAGYEFMDLVVLEWRLPTLEHVALNPWIPSLQLQPLRWSRIRSIDWVWSKYGEYREVPLAEWNKRVYVARRALRAELRSVV